MVYTRLINKNFLLPKLVAALAITVQLLRIFLGVDFNDEMQYYGEISSLLSSRKLFSSDIFIQQSAYIFLMPFFEPITPLSKTDHLIISGRVLFALYIMFIYFRVARILTSTSTHPIAASLSAFAITFYIPLANIYAFSYNSIGMGMLALCFAEFYAWGAKGKKESIPFWIIALTILGVGYPPLAIAVGLVLITRILVLGEYIFFVKLSALGAVMVLVLICVFSLLTTTEQLLESVKFSGGFGVAWAIFSNRFEVLGLISIVFICGLLITINKYTPISVREKFEFKHQVLIRSIVILGTILAVFLASELIGLRFFSCMIIVFLSLILSLFSIDGHRVDAWFWLVLLFMTSVCTMGVTSSNGLGMVFWPTMIASVFLFSLSIADRCNDSSILSTSLWSRLFLLTGIIIMSLLYYFGYPYQDDKIWRMNAFDSKTPEFRRIMMTEKKAKALSLIRAKLGDIPERSKVLIIGPHPWIYFAINAKFDTDMFFMHPGGSKDSKRILALKLEKRRPEFLVLTGVTSSETEAAVTTIIQKGQYFCDERSLDSFLVNAKENIHTLYDMSDVLTVCRRTNLDKNP
jgi:hypothetical protein